MKSFFSRCMLHRTAVLGMAFLYLAGPASAQPAPVTTRHVDSDSLARAGLTRVDDLFWLLPGWQASSLDGYTTRPSALGQPAAPLLLAGSQPLAGGLFGLPPLALLPVHLSQVEAVEASTTPQLVAGRLAPAGMVRLRLRDPDTRFGIRGAYSAGNEVGDPGPFRSTPLAVPNVDRIGPQYFVQTHLASRRTRLQLSLRALRHFTTDSAIRQRVDHWRSRSAGPPLQQLIAPRLTLEARYLGQHRIHAHFARLRGLPFFETLGYELPALQRHAQAGIAGRLLPRGTGAGLPYRLSYTHARLATDADRMRTSAPPELDFTGSENSLSGHLELPPLSLSSSLRLQAGLSADYTRVQARSPLRDPTLLTTRAYARLSPAPSATHALRPRLTLLLSKTDEQLGGGALASSSVQLAPGQQIGVHLGYLRLPYAEDPPLWYWLAQGLDLPRAPEGRIALPSSFPPSHRFSARLRSRHTFDDNSYAALEMSMQHVQQLALPQGRYDYDPSGGGLVPDLSLNSEVEGQTFNAAVEGGHVFPAGLHHRLRYDLFAHHAAGSRRSRQAFRQRFLRVPRHQLRYTASLAVRDRFSLAGRFTLRSPEHWIAYRPAARAEGSPYQSHLPTTPLLALTATKRFWKDHLYLRLALRNLLDAPHRTHPAGPVHQLSLFISLQAAF